MNKNEQGKKTLLHYLKKKILIAVHNKKNGLQFFTQIKAHFSDIEREKLYGNCSKEDRLPTCLHAQGKITALPNTPDEKTVDVQSANGSTMNFLLQFKS